jgi:DNA repair protein RadC
VFINTFIHTTNERLTALTLEPITERTLRFWMTQGLVSKPERVGRNNMYLGKHVDEVITLRATQWEVKKALSADKAVKALFTMTPIAEIADDGGTYTVPQVEFRIVGETKLQYGKVRGPEQCADLLRSLTDGLTDERFYSICLDNRNTIIAVHLCSIGDHASTLVHPRSVFRTAVYCSAVAIVVGHNHPSGDPEPSAEDIAVTRRLYEAGKVLGIPVMDHVIIAGPLSTSMRQKGYL